MVRIESSPCGLTNLTSRYNSYSVSVLARSPHRSVLRVGDDESSEAWPDMLHQLRGHNMASCVGEYGVSEDR